VNFVLFLLIKYLALTPFFPNVDIDIPIYSHTPNFVEDLKKTLTQTHSPLEQKKTHSPPFLREKSVFWIKKGRNFFPLSFSKVTIIPSIQDQRKLEFFIGTQEKKKTFMKTFTTKHIVFDFFFW